MILEDLEHVTIVFRPAGFRVGVESKGRVWRKFGSWGSRGTFCRIGVGAFNCVGRLLKDQTVVIGWCGLLSLRLG